MARLSYSFFLLQAYSTEGTTYYDPDRIIVLVLDDLDQEVIRPPITDLMRGNVIDVVC